MFNKIKKREAAELLIKKLVGDIRDVAIPIDNSINFIRDYGNMTKRKNHKLKRHDYDQARNSILGLPISIVVSMYLINKSKRLKKKYIELVTKVEDQFRKEIFQAKQEKNGNN